MKSSDLVKNLAMHPVLASEMSMRMQMGLPYLERRNGKLCMSFKPHREEFEQGNIAYYKPQYEVVFIYPFNHIAKFEVLAYVSEDISVSEQNDEMNSSKIEDGKGQASQPVCRIETEYMLQSGKRLISELFDACDRILDFQEKDGKVSDVSITKYQKLYQDTVEKLGLTAVYGDGTE